MPSEKVLGQKQQKVADLTEQFKSAVAGVVVDYKGINVADDTKLRKELREAGVHYTVEKNTMLRFAAKNVGFEDLNPVLEGTTAIATSTEDPMAPAKILYKYAQSLEGNPIKIKAGFMDGAVVDADTVVAIAKTPSREVLIGKMLSSLNATIWKFAVVLDQIAKKDETPAAE